MDSDARVVYAQKRGHEVQLDVAIGTTEFEGYWTKSGFNRFQSVTLQFAVFF